MLADSWVSASQGVTLQIETDEKGRSEWGEKTSLILCAVHGKLQQGVGEGNRYRQEERCFWLGFGVVGR